MAFVAMMGATAQNTITPVDYDGYYSGVIPRMFTNGAYVYFQNYDGSSDAYSDTVNIINGNFQTEKTFVLNLDEQERNGATEIFVYNYDAELMYDEVRTCFTQTLFNNDNKFEYIRAVFASSTVAYYYDVERYEIVSDDGTVVGTITWDDGYQAAREIGIHIVKFDNKYYIYFRIENGENRKIAWYRIDRQTQSIARVNDVPFNVFPTVMDRNSEITVELEEGTNAREIVLVDAMGREVKSVPVAQGQREVKISTQGLGAGLGFVSDRKNGAVKIIVR